MILTITMIVRRREITRIFNIIICSDQTEQISGRRTAQLLQDEDGVQQVRYNNKQAGWCCAKGMQLSVHLEYLVLCSTAVLYQWGHWGDDESAGPLGHSFNLQNCKLGHSFNLQSCKLRECPVHSTGLLLTSQQETLQCCIFTLFRIRLWWTDTSGTQWVRWKYSIGLFFFLK